MKKTAIAYIRVSTGKQAVSMQAQLERIKAYCALHEFELLEVLEDNAISGKNIAARPAMTKLISLARQGAVDAVVTLKLDRMFRNTVDAITIIPELQGLGVATHIMDLGGIALDTSTPMGSFFLTMAAAFGELERKQIGERTRMALRHKRDHGKQYSAVPPYGWRYEDGQLLEDAAEQVVLSIIWEMRAQGKPLRTIADRLHIVGHKTRTGKRIWQPNTISQILKNPLVLGKFSVTDNKEAHAADSSELHGDTATGNSQEVSHVSVH